MAHILHIDASPRGERSVSRMLSREFVAAWKQRHPEDTVTYRDVGREPVPHVDEPWIAAAFSPPDSHTPALREAIRVSDALVAEFLAADRYVLGVPMHNFSIPSTLKAYIDQIVRVGRTFERLDNGFKGLVSGKKLLVIAARGGAYRPGMATNRLDYQEPYLRTMFGFMGIVDISFIYAENLMSAEEACREQSLAEAREAIRQAVETW
ncbi:MAG TPA: FMN-dependent NADH-azoreductase [Candidatus Hydrogenedentes bacterium]|nr:FMN-dependent NADH-azoreductase [Candidatus Hydrogenedentota bacterium]